VKNRSRAAVAARARADGIPCIAIAGCIGEGVSALHDIGIDAVFSLYRGRSTLEEAQRNASALLEGASEQVVRACFISQPARPSAVPGRQ
jgi:glycerate kinase